MACHCVCVLFDVHHCSTVCVWPYKLADPTKVTEYLGAPWEECVRVDLCQLAGTQLAITVTPCPGYSSTD